MQKQKLYAGDAIEIRLQNPNHPPFIADDFVSELQYLHYRHYICRYLTELLEIETSKYEEQLRFFEIKISIERYYEKLEYCLERAIYNLYGEENRDHVRGLVIAALKNDL
jgi:hypothetical protein